LSNRKSIPVGEEPGAVISEVLFQVRPGVTSDRMADYPKKNFTWYLVQVKLQIQRQNKSDFILPFAFSAMSVTWCVFFSI